MNNEKKEYSLWLNLMVDAIDLLIKIDSDLELYSEDIIKLQERLQKLIKIQKERDKNEKAYIGEEKISSNGAGSIIVMDYKTGENLYRLKHIIRHSPDGMNWGYSGSGPADASLSILIDCVGVELAEKYYQKFKTDIIANLPYTEWVLEGEDIYRIIETYKVMDNLTKCLNKLIRNILERNNK